MASRARWSSASKKVFAVDVLDCEVSELPGFDEEPGKSNEEVLEAIQMA